MLAVLRTTGSVVWRHGPTLFALIFAGLGTRAFLQLAAVHVAGFSPVAGLLVFILVPIATMTAMILMLRVVRPSLPHLALVHRPVGGGRRLLDGVGSVLLPFLAVYASYGYLQADRASYYYGTWLADPTGPLRVPTKLGVTLLAAVSVALVLRWWLGRSRWAKARPWTGFAGAYLEIVWIAVGASLVSPLQAAVWSWTSNRRAVSWATDLGHSVVSSTHGVLGRLAVVLGPVLGAADTVIAVPVAWLAVGAVVYGREIATGPTRLGRRAARAWVRVPSFARRLVEPAGEAAGERFGPLRDGLRVLTRVGLAPMLVFCLLFLMAQNTDVWLFELERAVIGPQDLFRVWMPLSGPLGVVNDAVRTVVLVALLAAAADRALAASAADRGARGPVAAPVSGDTAPQPLVPARRHPDDVPTQPLSTVR